MLQQQRIPAPSGHPLVNSLVQKLAGGDHDGNMDGPNGWIYKVRRLPGDHPNLDKFFLIANAPSGLPITAFSGHPNADQAYKAGQAVSSKHPTVAGMFPKGALPPNHPDVDALLRSPKANPLPSWHPSLESMLKRRAVVNVQIAAWSGKTTCG